MNTSFSAVRSNLTLVLLVPAFFGIAVSLHYPGFTSPMIYDSVGFIKENSHIFAKGDVAEVLGIVPARPLFMLSLYANFLWSGMEPAAFRWCNAFLLACAGMMLSALCVVVLNVPVLKHCGTREQKLLVSMLMGLLFVVHPLQGLAVLYIWQREALMGCFFFLSGLAVYLAGRSGQWIRPVPAYVLTSLLFLAGMMSKENVITLPVALLMAELILLRERNEPAAEDTGLAGDSQARAGIRFTGQDFWKRAAVVAMIAMPPLIGWLLLINSLHGPDATHSHGVINRLVQYYGSAGLTPVEVALTECRVVLWYLLSILAPFFSGVDLVGACVISRSLWNPPTTAAALVGVVGLVCLGIGLIRKHPATAFGILMFLVSLAPESLLIPQYLFCGYRAILPTAWVLLAIAPFVLRWFSGTAGKMPRFVCIGLMVTATVGLAAMTFVQARAWNPVAVWQGAYDKLPAFSQDVEATPYLDILGSYGLELSNSGDYPKAIEVLNRCMAIDSRPNDFKRILAMVNLGMAYIKTGNKTEGLKALRFAVKFDPNDSWSRYQLAAALMDQKHTEEGFAELKKAVALNPRYPPSLLYLANVLREKGLYEEAIEHYTAAAGLDPKSGAVYNGLGVAQEKKGNLEAAVESFQSAIQREPQSADYHFNLAKTLAQAGRIPEAIANYRKATELNPAMGPAHANLGTLLLRSGRPAESVSSFARASDLLPGNPEIHYQMGLALLSLSRSAEATEQFQKALAINPQHAGARQNLDRMPSDQGRQ